MRVGFLLRIAFLFLTIFFVVSVPAQTLEERVKQLEEKVRQLEERLNRLEGRTEPSNVEPSVEDDVITVGKNQNLVEYRVLSKKFKPVRLKESLWQRSDLIILKMVFKNNTGKEVENISGKVMIFDKEGHLLMERKINVNKALNFLRGMTIKPGEEVKMSVEFEYDPNNENHRKVKELPLNQLVIKFYPSVIKFTDGTEKYIRYREH